MHEYAFSILAVPIIVKARNLAAARIKIYRRYLAALGSHLASYPVLPPILLLATSDSSCEQEDSRLSFDQTYAKKFQCQTDVTQLHSAWPKLTLYKVEE